MKKYFAKQPITLLISVINHATGEVLFDSSVRRSKIGLDSIEPFFNRFLDSLYSSDDVEIRVLSRPTCAELDLFPEDSSVDLLPF